MQQEFARLAQDLGAHMREKNLTQSYIAEKAHVNQSTVSRFLKNPPRRNTATVLRLCEYAKTLLSGTSLAGDRAAAQHALDECLKSSDAHAQAVSKILNALAELCRHDRHEEVMPG